MLRIAGEGWVVPDNRKTVIVKLAFEFSKT